MYVFFTDTFLQECAPPVTTWGNQNRAEQAWQCTQNVRIADPSRSLTPDLITGSSQGRGPEVDSAP